MLNRGYNSDLFLIMMLQTGRKPQTKGVLYPFLTPMVLTNH